MTRDAILSMVLAVTVALALGPALALGAGGGFAGAQDGPVSVDDSAATAPECEYPLETTDVTGQKVTVEESPDRIVALQPSDAQTVYEIGAEDRLVGFPISDDYTGYLDAGDRTDISQDDGLTVDSETVIDLEPDVVLAANTALFQEGLVDELREAGLTVYVYDSASSIEDIQQDVLMTGALVDECEGATNNVDWMDDRMQDVEDRLEDTDRPLVYYAMGDGFTPGTGTFQHEMLERAGFENVAERAGIEGWDVISEEVIVEEDVDWIVYDDTWDEPPIEEGVMETTAYQDDQLIVVDSNWMSQPGPLVVEMIDLMATAHLETADDEPADDTADDQPIEDDATDDEEVVTDDTVVDDEPVADDAVPGLGPVAGVIAVITGLALLFVRHR